MSDLAENLRALMAERGWNQPEAAQILGVSQPNIGRWLRGETEPQLAVLLKVAAAFDVSVDELVRAPSKKMREAKADYAQNIQQGRWFRQLRVTWRDHPEERDRIELGIRRAWPNQCREILAWLDKS